MRIGDIALLAAAAAAVYLVMSAKKGAPAAAAGAAWVPWQQTNNYQGWNYYNDGDSGLAISPDGGYYLNGELVWSPQSRGMM